VVEIVSEITIKESIYGIKNNTQMYNNPMEQYKCECKCTFTTKQSLERHKNSGSCRLRANSKTNKKMFKCSNPKCKSKFSRADSLKRHAKTCKYKTNICKQIINGDNNNKNTFNATNDGDINYNNSTVNKLADTFNLNLVVFGNDGPESLITPKLIEILNSKGNLYESALKAVNFDKKSPEHHNVYCDDLKSGNGHVYGENGWSSKRLDEILEKILDSKTSDFNKLCDLFGDHLSEKTRNRIKNAISEVRGIDDEGKLYPSGDRKKLKAYIKNILYDNRDMVKETRNKTKKIPSKSKKYRPKNEEESNDDSCEEI